MLWPIRMMPSSFLFQSAPDREVGRCICAAIAPAMPLKFQSAPDREVGRCPCVKVAALVLLGVSIRARP